jgi:hypothetical protein
VTSVDRLRGSGSADGKAAQSGEPGSIVKFSAKARFGNSGAGASSGTVAASGSTIATTG